MTIRTILTYIKNYLGTYDSDVEREFIYFINKKLDSGISSDELYTYSINLYKNLLVQNTNVKTR